MAFVQKDGSGALFRNDRKTKDNQPDYQGNCMVDGIEYDMAGWKKEGRSGDTFLSLKISPKGERNGGRGRQGDRENDYDAEIPF